MFIYNLFQFVFYFNKYELADSTEVNLNLIYFKIGLLLIIFIIYC